MERTSEEALAGAAAVIPNLDSIAEFRVLTSNFDAEYGEYAGGLVSTVTKSGTDQIHGSVFEFLRNTDPRQRIERKLGKGSRPMNRGETKSILLTIIVMLTSYAALGDVGGKLAGTVKDQTDAALEGVTVTVINTATGAKQTSKTDAQRPERLRVDWDEQSGCQWRRSGHAELHTRKSRDQSRPGERPSVLQHFTFQYRSARIGGEFSASVLLRPWQ